MKLGLCIIITLSTVFLFFNHRQSIAEPQQNVTTKAIIKSVYDGDTVVVIFQKEARIRMLDCWAKEIRTTDPIEKEEGLKAKKFLQSILQEGDEVLVQIPTTHRLQDSMTFGRLLAYLWKDVDGEGKMDNLSEEMVKQGYATQEKEN